MTVWVVVYQIDNDEDQSVDSVKVFTSEPPESIRNTTLCVTILECEVIKNA